MHSVSSGKLLFLQDFLSKFSKYVLGFARVDLQMIEINFSPFPAIYVIFHCGNPYEGRLPFFQRFPVKQRFGQAVAEGRVRYLSAEGRVRYLFAEDGGDAH
jgi:hypothetical protein